MNQWIFLHGALFQGTVYKDRLLHKPIQIPVDGGTGFAIFGQTEVTLEYNTYFKVWHLPGLDVEKYKSVLEAERREV